MTPYYADKLTTLYHGDCLEVMDELAPASFDAVICDPPYGTTACAWDSVIPFAPMWAAIKRLIRPRAPVVLFGSQPFTSALVMSNPRWFKYAWVWEKNVPSGFLNANKQPMRWYEDIVVFYRSQPTYNPQRRNGAGYRVMVNSVKSQNYGAQRDILSVNDGMEYYPRDILQFDNENGGGKLHPTQKPLALLEYLVKTYTDDGGRVLDFTCGSGTTLRACKNLGRFCVGIERERHYCDVTVKRLAPAFEDALPTSGAVDWSGTLFEAVQS